MARKDYYLLLGISRGESPSGIRSAFRDLVRRHHPDRAGPSGTPMFRDVVEAYRVLSDPERRREYDAELGTPIRIRTSGIQTPGVAKVRSAREPVHFDDLDLFADAGRISPASEELFAHILRNFVLPGRPKSERPEPLLCDVALSRGEARSGGVLPLRIPIRSVCPDCHGAGHVFGFACRRCDATGDAPSEVIVPLDVPRGVPSGTIVEVPLHRFGIRNLWLRARIHVRE
jgi:DnaJ-class molecular chaperone